VEINGVSSPLYAIRPADQEPWTSRRLPSGFTEHSRPVFFPPRGQSRLVCNFSFFTAKSHYVMPIGYAMNWSTVAAPAE